MPEYATINAEVNCWNCGGTLDSNVNIQWGKLPAGYRVGDEIRWFAIGDEMTPPFVLVEGQSHWNCGDPQFSSLLALDCDAYAADADVEVACPTCKEQIGVVAVKIENNRIVSVDSFSKQQFTKLVGHASNTEADIFTLSNGKYEARSEWYDHSIKYVEQFP